MGFPNKFTLVDKAVSFRSDPSHEDGEGKRGIEIVRGHDLRRTFGAACEKLGFSDRQTKRMLGHASSGGESVGRYTGQDGWDLVDRMSRVEDLMLSKAPSVFNALRPRGAARMLDTEDVVATNIEARASRRKPRVRREWRCGAIWTFMRNR